MEIDEKEDKLEEQAIEIKNAIQDSGFATINWTND